MYRLWEIRSRAYVTDKQKPTVEPWQQAFMSLSAFVFGLACLLPFPAFPIGRSTGLQSGSILAIFFIATLSASLVKRNIRGWLLLLVPLVISSFSSSFLGSSLVSTTNSLTVTLAWGLFTLPLAVTGTFLLSNTRALLFGSACGIFLHCGLGLYQLYSFKQGIFPFVELYQNPSFTAFDETFAQTVALYIQRPFGLFPEPSAMAASIGPWLLLFLVYALRLLPDPPRARLGKGMRMCLIGAFLAGMWLIYASASGAALILSPALLTLFCVFLLKRSRSAASAFFGLLGSGFFAMVIMGTAYLALADRVTANFATDSSWSLRFRSIVGGFNLLTERGWLTWLTGLGSGQSAHFMQSNLGLDAVWSVVFSYAVENGALGSLVWVSLSLFVAAAVWKSSARTVGFVLLTVWLLGFTLVTSYFSLLSAWSFFGLLLNWDHLIAPKGTIPFKHHD